METQESPLEAEARVLYKVQAPLDHSHDEPCPCCGDIRSLKDCGEKALHAGVKRGLQAGAALAGLTVLMAAVKGRFSMQLVRGAATSPDTARFTVAVTLLTAVPRLVRCALAQWRGKDDKAAAALSVGLGAALAVSVEKRQRKEMVALYLFVRSVHTLWASLARILGLPSLSTTAAFGLANAVIMYGFVMEPALLDPSYYKWMLSVANVPHDVLAWTIRDPVFAQMRQALQRAGKLQPGPLPPGATDFGIGVINPPYAHPPHGHVGRVDMPVIDLQAAEAVAGVRSPLREAQQAVLPKADVDALRPLANKLWSDLGTTDTAALRNPEASQQRWASIVAPGSDAAAHIHAAKPLLDRAWMHAALVGSAQPSTAFRPCDVTWHPGVPCAIAHALEAGPTFLRTLRVYTPVHLLPLLLFKSRSLTAQPLHTLLKTSRSIAYSALFLTTYVWIVKQMVCLLRVSRQGDAAWQAAAAGVAGALALRWEGASRASELQLYCSTKAVAASWTLLERRGYVRSVRGGHSLLIIAAFTLLALADRQDHRAATAALLKWLWGEDQRSLQDLQLNPAAAVSALFRTARLRAAVRA